MTNFAEEGRSGNFGAARTVADPTADSRAGGAVATAPGPEEIRDLLAGKFVCPFCGSINESEQGLCPRCTMENSPASRKATKSRIGPWYVLQTRNPAAPGMKFETLLNFARKGRVKPKSIVRGPTTHQLWKFAAQVKGLSREFGVCYSCGGSIEANASLCPQCNRLQDPPANPDVLLETRDAPAPAVVPPPAARAKEPDLAGIDAEFVVPALGGAAAEDSLAGVSMSGSVAGVPFDPGGVPRKAAPVPPTAAGGNGAAPAAFVPTGPARNSKKDEGFLSPKDLAAAFKLNFSPSAETEAADRAPNPPQTDRLRAPRGTADGRTGRNGDDRRQPRPRHPLDFQPIRPTAAADPADVLAAPTFDPAMDESLALPRPGRKPIAPPPRPRRLFRVLRVVTFMVLFGGALYGTALYLDPTLRQQSLQYIDQGKTALLQSLNGSKPATGPATEPTAAPQEPVVPDLTHTVDISEPGASAAPAAPSDASNPAGSPAAAPEHGGDAQPASASAAGTPPGLPVTRPASDPVASTALTPPAATTQSASVVTPSSLTNTQQTLAGARPAPIVAAPPQPAIDPTTACLKLYREAMRVAASDPAKAIAGYNAIKKLPQEYWPVDLDVRIRMAEDQLKNRH